MRKFVLIVFLMVGGLQLWAADDTYEFLTFEKKDGTSLSFTAIGLSLTFGSETVTVASNGVTETFNLSDLEKMYFSSTEATAINQVALPSSGKTEIFSMDGRLLPANQLSSLPKGVYIVKNNGVTRKVTVR